jgi:hypothetical protein
MPRGNIANYSQLREYLDGMGPSAIFFTRVANTLHDIPISKTSLLMIAREQGVKNLDIVKLEEGNLGFYWTK